MANDMVTAPKGFWAAGVKCGIKKSGSYDLGLIVCPWGAKAAAVFTTNKITSAAVQISRKHIKSDTVYAVVVNSGNANACTRLTCRSVSSSGESGLPNVSTSRPRPAPGKGLAAARAAAEGTALPSRRAARSGPAAAAASPTGTGLRPPGRTPQGLRRPPRPPQTRLAATAVSPSRPLRW